MKETKFITSGGLAFFEAKDMEKLHKYSLKGWHVKAFNFMGYTLEKGEKVNYTYSIDYQTLNNIEREEYFNYFELADWNHITSTGNIHLFRAENGTPPIYTDQETTIEKYENLRNSITKFTIPFVVMTILFWILTLLTSGVFKTSVYVVAIIFSIIAFPALGTLVAAYQNKWKEEEEAMKVNLAKTIPILCIFIALISMLFFNGRNVTLDILMSMIIGAIGFPLIIYIVMSLYHKVKK